MAQALLRNMRFLVLVLIILLFLFNVAYLVNTAFVTETNNPEISDSISYMNQSNASLRMVYVPPPPSNLSVRFSDEGVLLTWSQSYYSHYSAQDDIGHKIYRRQSFPYGGGSGSSDFVDNWTCIATIDNNTYTDHDVKESTTYYYAVTALGPGTESPLSDWAGIETPSSIGPTPYPWWFAVLLAAIGVVAVHGAYRFTAGGWAAAWHGNEPVNTDRSRASKLIRRSRIGGILGLVLFLTSLPVLIFTGWFTIVTSHSSSYDAEVLFILLPMAIVQAAAGILIFRSGKHIRNDIMRQDLSRARSRVQICIVWGAIAVVSSLFNPILFAIISQSAWPMFLGFISALIPIAPTVLFSITYPDFIGEPDDGMESRVAWEMTDGRTPGIFDTGEKDRLWFAFGIVGSIFIIAGAFSLLLLGDPFGETPFYLFLSSSTVMIGLVFSGLGFMGYYVRYKSRVSLLVAIVAAFCSALYQWIVASSVVIAYRNQDTAQYIGHAFVVVATRYYRVGEGFYQANVLIGFLLLIMAFVLLVIRRQENISSQRNAVIYPSVSLILAGAVFIGSQGHPAGWALAIVAEVLIAILFYRTPGRIESSIESGSTVPSEKEQTPCESPPTDSEK